MSKELVMNQLFDLCEQFIKDNKIRCVEDFYQSDHIAENAHDLIAQICEIVGYDESEYDDD